MTKDTCTFLLAALNQISEKRNVQNSYTNDALLADTILQYAPNDVVPMKIAVAFNAFRDARRGANEATGPYVGPKPEALLSFTQRVMNKACWLARAQGIAQTKQDQEEEVRGTTGIDFAQDVAEERCESYVSRDRIPDVILSDFADMAAMHSVLGEECDYLGDIEPLVLFGQRVKVEKIDEETGAVYEDWVSAFETCSWTDALNQMDTIATNLRESNAEQSLIDKIRERMSDRNAA